MEKQENKMKILNRLSAIRSSVLDLAESRASGSASTAASSVYLRPIDESDLLLLKNQGNIISLNQRSKGLKVIIDPSYPQFHSSYEDHAKDIHALSDWEKEYKSKILSQIRNCEFHVVHDEDEIVIGPFDMERYVEISDGVERPCGLFNASFSGKVMIFGGKTRISNSMVSNSIVLKDSVIHDCARVTTTGKKLENSKEIFGNGKAIPIGPETGGRETIIFAGLSFVDASRMAMDRSNQEYQNHMKEAAQAVVDQFLDVQKILTQSDSLINIFDEGSKCISTPLVKDVYLGRNSIIKDALSVEDSTILDHSYIKSGSIVKRSVLDDHSVVDSIGIVEDSMLCPESHVETRGNLHASILGSFSSVAKGEATSCLIGPLVGFHHQSLLIACLWPKGRGNIGYGAKVGSNHTGKAPDQELISGEGVFYGLGCSIKFPSDFSRAPYSLFATGVVSLPQKITFPFSLIISGSDSAMTAKGLNEIYPGWMLSDNYFLIARNEQKFKKRMSALKDVKLDARIFRPSIILLMKHAIDMLSLLINKEPTQLIFTERDYAGLGKNYLSRDGCIKGLNAYSRFTRFYALEQFMQRLGKYVETNEWVKIRDVSQELHKSITYHDRFSVGIESDLSESEMDDFITQIIKEELKFCSPQDCENGNVFVNQARQYAEEYMRMRKENVEMATKSKEKDDIRGKHIVDDYETVHTAASSESVIKTMQKMFMEEEERVKTVLERLIGDEEGNITLSKKGRI